MEALSEEIASPAPKELWTFNECLEDMQVASKEEEAEPMQIVETISLPEEDFRSPAPKDDIFEREELPEGSAPRCEEEDVAMPISCERVHEVIAASSEAPEEIPEEVLQLSRQEEEPEDLERQMEREKLALQEEQADLEELAEQEEARFCRDEIPLSESEDSDGDYGRELILHYPRGTPQPTYKAPVVAAYQSPEDESDPNVRTYFEALKNGMRSGDMQYLAELVFEIKAAGLEDKIDLRAAEDMIFGDE